MCRACPGLLPISSPALYPPYSGNALPFRVAELQPVFVQRYPGNHRGTNDGVTAICDREMFLVHPLRGVTKRGHVVLSALEGEARRRRKSIWLDLDYFTGIKSGRIQQ